VLLGTFVGLPLAVPHVQTAYRGRAECQRDHPADHIREVSEDTLRAAKGTRKRSALRQGQRGHGDRMRHEPVRWVIKLVQRLDKSATKRER